MIWLGYVKLFLLFFKENQIKGFNCYLTLFQSVTCGIDEVEIFQHMNRPIGIGIYGHPTQMKSKYSLQLKPLSSEESNTQYESMDKEYEANNKMYDYVSSSKYKSPQKPPNKPAEDESILWTILIGLLKILLEILT